MFQKVAFAFLTTFLVGKASALEITPMNPLDSTCTSTLIINGDKRTQSPAHTMILGVVTTSTSQIACINFKELSDYSGFDVVDGRHGGIDVWDPFILFEKEIDGELSRIRKVNCGFDHLVAHVTRVSGNRLFGSIQSGVFSVTHHIEPFHSSFVAVVGEKTFKLEAMDGNTQYKIEVPLSLVPIRKKMPVDDIPY